MGLLKSYKVTKHPFLVRGLAGTVIILFLSLVLSSCGESKGHFKIEGRFLHINTGELYIYSPDGVIDGMDTIKIQDGRFALELPCRDDGTLMIVFPNYSPQPIFAESGGSVEVKADASYLKEMEVKGTDANELMTKFRKAVSNASPPEEKKFAEQFVKDHPESPVSVYITRRYFVDADKPDFAKAAQLTKLLMKSQKSSGSLVRLKEQVDLSSISLPGKTLPKFTATDVNGKTITNADLNAPTAIINVWATWSYESTGSLSNLNRVKDIAGDKLKIISICLDANKNECKRTMSNNNVEWPVICDGSMLESKLMRQFGLSTVPENIILKNGKIFKSGLNATALNQWLDENYH